MSIAICITAGEQSENHAGMNINGNGLCETGFTTNDLKHFNKTLAEKNIKSHYYRLDYIFENREEFEPAGLLIIRNGVERLVNNSASEMLKEQLEFEWDKKYWDVRRQRVLNKHARYNVCYGVAEQKPDYENKKGTIVSYESVPILREYRNSLEVFFGEKAKNLEVEGNLYYDVKKCGIGFHGDSERKKVIGCSLGASRPIHWQWYEDSKPIGKRIKFMLHSGDMYIMSEKTSGHDWKQRSKKTLRHAAGEKYVK